MNHKMMNTYARPDIIFSKGSGSWMYDTEGTAYLDLVAGVAVNALGHAHPDIVQTLHDQGQQMIHCSNLYYNDKQLALAEKLTGLADMKSVFFVNSGTEAIEAALKLARKHGTSISPSKNILLYLNNSFHGRTLGSLSVTGQPKYQKDFLPLIGGTLCLEKDDPALLEVMFNENICGIILEPIQGEGGIIPINPEFIEKARSLCDQFNALMIFDEVQCGVGRTGKMFAFEHLPAKPDIVCLAKGLGGGFPIGAVIVNERADCFSKGDHGCTFGGSPLACAVSLAVLEHIADENFLKEVHEKGAWAIAYIQSRLAQEPSFVKMAGKGLLLGVHLNKPVTDIIQTALAEHILLVNAGPQVIRLVPALNIPFEEWKTGIMKVCDLIIGSAK